MSKTVQHFLSVILCAVLLYSIVVIGGFNVFAISSKSDKFNTGYSITGNGAQDIVNVALKQEGMTNSTYKYEANWCSAFVSDCAKLAGQSGAVPWRGNQEDLKSAVLNVGGTQIYKKTGSYSETGFSDARVGDLVFINWNDSNASGTEHVEIVYKTSGGKIYTVGGNTDAGVKVRTRSTQNGYEKTVWVVRPKYTSTTPTDTSKPEIKVNVGTSTTNTTITLSKKNTSASRHDLHIYYTDGRTYLTDSFDNTNSYSVKLPEGTFTFCVVAVVNDNLIWGESKKYTIPKGRHSLTVNYYSNYADKSFANPLNAVGSNKNILVKTSNFHSDTEYPDGLHNYSNSGNGTYLGRTGYTATGNWNTKADGSGYSVNQNTAFSNGQALAQALGKNISNADATVNLYPEWTENALTVNYYSNYADKSFANSLNAVASDKNVVVKTYKFYYSDNDVEDGLHNYTNSGNTCYLGRTGYTATGNWNTKADGTGISINQNTSFASCRNLALAFGKDLSTGSYSINLYPEWTRNTLVINYYSNYADKSFENPTNQVGADRNVLVWSCNVRYGAAYQNGLANYSNSTNDTYLGRTGYTATGNWNTKPDGTGISVNQNTAFETGQAFAQALGKDISSGNSTINLYPEWVANPPVVNPTAGSGAVVDESTRLIYGLSAGETQGFVAVTDGTATYEYPTAKSVMGTGTRVYIFNNDQQLVNSYTVVLFGDVDGDSWYDGTDAYLVNLVANGMVSAGDLTEAQRAAADCNHDGTVDNADVALLEQAGLLLANVDQTLPQEELQTDSVYLEYCSLIDQSIEIIEPKQPAAEQPAQTAEPQPAVQSVWGWIKALFTIVLNWLLRVF